MTVIREAKELIANQEQKRTGRFNNEDLRLLTYQDWFLCRGHL